MHTDQIYIARDGKSGMHVLVRILAVDDIGKDYLPIDPDDFNKVKDNDLLVLIAKTEPSFNRTAPFLVMTLQTSIIRRTLKMRAISCFYIWLV